MTQDNLHRDGDAGCGSHSKFSKDDFINRLRAIRATRWVRFGLVALIYILWVIWMGNPWLLLVLPLLFDIYITSYIPLTWWKSSKSKATRMLMSWVDAIVYALVLVYFVFAFIGQNYKIPSSSLEKTLLVGDFLWVNKAVYGPRVPQTPLHFPFFLSREDWGDQKESRNRCVQVLVTCQEADVLCRYPHKHSR